MPPALQRVALILVILNTLGIAVWLQNGYRIGAVEASYGVFHVRNLLQPHHIQLYSNLLNQLDMRFTSSTAAALCFFISLSSAVLGQVELEARDGGKDDHHRNAPCFPFIFDKGCVRGRCPHKCDVGFSIDPLRLCCVRQHHRRGDDRYGGHDGGYGGGKGGDKNDHGHDGGYGGGKGSDKNNHGHDGGHDGGYRGGKDHDGGYGGGNDHGKGGGYGGKNHGRGDGGYGGGNNDHGHDGGYGGNNNHGHDGGYGGNNNHGHDGGYGGNNHGHDGGYGGNTNHGHDGGYGGNNNHGHDGGYGGGKNHGKGGNGY
ncbi:hypothetical protein DFH09DRAFT_1375030 [Mycena vulgaris]|nr:hypothetical protein DFH09DRAFT_1375030 [Mycena vulgaris]